MPAPAGISGLANGKILLSLLVFLAGASLPVLYPPRGTVDGGTFSDALWSGYILWVLFWGAPPCWRLCQRSPFAFHLRDFHDRRWIRGSFCFGLVITCVWFYSALGGGIYQFAKHWWRVKQAAT